MKYRHLTPLFLTILILLPLTLTSSSGVPEDFPKPISNIIEGECSVAAPMIEVIEPCEGCGEGRILPETVGINEEYVSKINVSLAAGIIHNVNIIILFTSDEISFTESDVTIEMIWESGSKWDTFSCGLRDGSLLCNYNIGDLQGVSNVYELHITIKSEEWLDKDFSYELYIGHL